MLLCVCARVRVHPLHLLTQVTYYDDSSYEHHAIRGHYKARFLNTYNEQY